MTAISDDTLYYDPYDVGIDADPYPTYRRLRDEAPLYHNERLDFWALSRFDDVEAALRDVTTFSSARGDILEVVQANPTMPPGIFINEDPPLHTIHRSLVSRMFTPRRMREIEDRVRAFCVACLEPHADATTFDFVAHLGAELPMRAVGMLLGIPDADQPTVRDQAGKAMRNEAGRPLPVPKDSYVNVERYADYVEWRADHPSDDLITELLNVEFEDQSGDRRALTRQEILVFLAVIAGAGFDTTGRLFGWMGKLFGEHPDQRHQVAADRTLIPGAIEELLRCEPPGPHVARYVTTDVQLHGTVVPAGSAMLLMVGSGNHDERRFPDPERFDVRRADGNHLSFGYGIHFCLGAALARLEGRVALDEVLNRFPDWEVDYQHAVRAPTSTVRGWDALPVFIR